MTHATGVSLTVLSRKEGWSDEIVDRLVEMGTVTSRRRSLFPDKVILFGHFSDNELRDAIGQKECFTSVQTTSRDPLLPYIPAFIL